MTLTPQEAITNLLDKGQIDEANVIRELVEKTKELEGEANCLKSEKKDLARYLRAAEEDTLYAYKRRDEVAAQFAWRPIVAVPRDGTHILCHMEGAVVESWYEDGEWCAAILSCHGCGRFSGSNDDPDHWMPLPAAPEVAE